MIDYETLPNLEPRTKNLESLYTRMSVAIEGLSSSISELATHVTRSFKNLRDDLFRVSKQSEEQNIKLEQYHTQDVEIHEQLLDRTAQASAEIVNFKTELRAMNKKLDTVIEQQRTANEQNARMLALLEKLVTAKE